MAAPAAPVAAVASADSAAAGAQVPVLVRALVRVRLGRARQLRARQPVLARRLQRRAVGAPAHWAVLVQRPVPAEPLPEGRVLALLVAAGPVDLLLSRR